MRKNRNEEEGVTIKGGKKDAICELLVAVHKE